jgi:hypothetical protein
VIIIDLASLPENKMPVIGVSARAAEQNPGSSIFTGWIMSYVDIACSRLIQI